MPERLSSDYRGPGLRVRFRRIRGVTPKGVLTDPLYLPCVTGDFAVDETADHRDYTTVAAGEFSVPAPGPASARLLRTTTLETLTIDWHRYARWLTNPHLTPEKAKRELQKILRHRRPFELLAILQLGSDEPQELRMNATLRSVNRVLRPGERDTRYYTLEIKEWRDNRVGRRAQGKPQGGRGKHDLPTTHTLKDPATTLYNLSHLYYGVFTEWRLIAAANGITTIGPATGIVSTKRWKLGDKVKIPALQTASINAPE